MRKKRMDLALSRPWMRRLMMATVILLISLLGETTSKPQAHYMERFSDTMDRNITALLNSFQIGYDKRVRPNYGGPAVIVGVTMFVLSISSLLEVQMDFTMDMYFRQFWRDPRLSFEAAPNLEKLVVGAEYIKKIWVPDTFFVNEKKAYFHEATSENQFLRIMHTGEILRSIRLTVTASCPMALQYFPMDRQTCFIDIESFGYTMSDIRYLWNDGLNSVQIASDVSLPQFKVIGHRQKTIEASLSTGNYSRLACEIRFVRSMGYYLIQIYIPSSLIVVISWVSFWLNRGASVARVNLGVTTVLTMTTLMAAVNTTLPKISYVKSIDVYLGACFFLVFASLLEYASVGYLAKRIQMQKNRYLAMQNKLAQDNNPNAKGTQRNSDHYQVPRGIRKSSNTPSNHGRYSAQAQHRSSRYDIEAPQPSSPSSLPPNPPPNPDCELKELNKMCGITASDIDKYSRIFFPVTFTCFQLMYWIIYQHLSDEDIEDLVYLEKDD